MRTVPYNKLTTNCLNLPRLPIPPLPDTLQRYKDSVKPLKGSEVVAAHLAKLQKFEDTTAADVQKLLIEQDQAQAKAGTYPHSYIESLWDDGYLAFRGPLPINISPGFSINKIPGLTGQAESAATFVHAMLRFVDKMLTDQLDVPEKNTFDVSAMSRQFGFARVPLPKRDEFRSVPLESARSITVVHKNRLYSVDVKDENGKVFPKQTLVAALNSIINTNSEGTAYPALGYLTSGGRDDWATSYSDLIEMDPHNKKIIEDIESSLVVVCLDSERWGKDNAVKLQAMLYGGTELGNRWYDKHQLLVDPDGALGMNLEHSFSDGVVWARWVHEAWCHLAKQNSGFSALPELKYAPEAAATNIIRPLEIKAGKTFSARIRTAEQEIQKLSRGVLLDEVVLPFGKAKLKKLHISPDAFCQMCMHWSYYQLRSKMAPTYESCSTGQYWHGRTETIRTATKEMRALVTSADMDSLSKLSTEEAETILAKMKAAAAKHQSLAKECAQGLGVDRHLLVLKEVTKTANDANGLEFFNDELFQYSGTWTMSSSNVSVPFMQSFNFGPVVPHGIGVGYTVDNDRISLCVSSFKFSSKAKIKEFCHRLSTGAMDLHNLLERTQPK